MIKLSSWITLLALFFSSYGLAETGFSLGGTRVIFHSDKNDVTLPVYNSTSDKIYLVQSWVSTTPTTNEHSKEFVVIPPLFRLNQKSSNLIRLLYTGHRLPQDRETLFWLNIKAIPGTSTKYFNNTLQIAFRTVIKLMYRPSGIDADMSGAEEMMKFNVNNNGLIVQNPTPYYITLTSVFVNGKSINLENNKHKGTNGLIAPFSYTQLGASGLLNHGKVRYSLINDYGGVDSFTTDIK